MAKYILGGLLAIIILAVGGVVATYIQYHNIAVRYETKLDAVWEENKVTLNSYTTKVQEAAQVPAMYRNDLQSVIEQTFSGRYGSDGSRGVVQFIQEKNLELDPVLYRQIQQIIESGRNDFKNSQVSLVDTKAAYQAQLNMFWSGLWMRIAGFPKVDLNKYKIVVLDDVNVKFETGSDTVIKLN